MKLLKLWPLALLLTLAGCCGKEEGGDARLSWDYSTFNEITDIALSNADYTEHNLCYPRIKKLSDGALLLTFMDQHFGFNIYSARSEDGGKTWSPAVLIKHWEPAESTVGADELVYVNPDFLELQDGRIILAFQWRYKLGYSDLPNTNNNCGIQIAFSEDKGCSWGESREVYRGRCWEPAFLQLPSGEIQMYITSSQEIKDKTSYPRTVIIRSFDGGQTWQGKPCCGIDDNETISRTIDERFAYDGMPTAVYLNDNRGILVPMEVWHGKMVVDQTPVVIKSDVETNWHLDYEKIKTEGGPDFPAKKEVNKDFHGYGPYGGKLPEGEVLVLSNGTYKGVQGVWVLVGNADGDDFYYATSPFDGYWGCIDYIGGGKVVACAGEKYFDAGTARYKIKHMTARVNRSKTLAKGGLELVPVSEFDRDSQDFWFLGKAGASCVYSNFGYTGENFLFGTYVFDNNIVAFTSENSDASAVLVSRGKNGDYENYQIIVNALGKVIVYKEYTRSWYKIWCGNAQVDLQGTINDGADSDLGYSALASVPWDVLGGRPHKGEVLRAHIRHHIKDKASEKPLGTQEDQEGENTDYPQEWLKLILK